MPRSLARFSGPESLIHTRSLADFITTTSGFRFSVHTGLFFHEALRELELFFAVLFEMSLHRLFRVSSAVNYVASSYVSMVCSLLVTSGLVMLGRFPMVASGMRQMF